MKWIDGDGVDTIVVIAVVVFALIAFLLGDGVR